MERFFKDKILIQIRIRNTKVPAAPGTGLRLASLLNTSSSLVALSFRTSASMSDDDLPSASSL